nr:MAG TPA: hypothetical protein [Caudoviricetes sp.]
MLPFPLLNLNTHILIHLQFLLKKLAFLMINVYLTAVCMNIIIPILFNP